MRWITAHVVWVAVSTADLAFWLIQWLGTQVSKAFRLLSRIFQAVVRLAQGLARIAQAAGSTAGKMRSEIGRFRGEARTVSQDLAAFTADQQAKNPLDPNKETVFLLITCGQAVRNFLLSDVLELLRARFNVVILSTYAYSESFRAEYSRPGVHVLPWFNSFRTKMERAFQYYFMAKSRSRTHHSWLANLEKRAKNSTSDRSRFRKLMAMRRLSEVLGALVGRRGVQGLYGSYFLSYLPKSLFTNLLSAYRPALVISTTAHHPEAWPLTYFARRQGVKTLANILSWDNTTTKAVMDVSCSYYTVWSDEMAGELTYQFPHIKTKTLVTGCPLFDMYYTRPYAVPREAFLSKLGLAADKPYILYTTNTPAAMPDEAEIVRQYWEALNRSPVAGQVSLLIRLHPKESVETYAWFRGLADVAVTLAAEPHWDQSDRWLPSREDMRLLLNSMLHASVSVNVASTMSLESFTLHLPTINVAFKSSDDLKDHGSMWSFDMYHFSEHYHALVENGAVDIARSVDELVDMTLNALQFGPLRKEAMRRTLEQKVAYCDGTSARRFVEAVEKVIRPKAVRTETRAPIRAAAPILAPAQAAE